MRYLITITVILVFTFAASSASAQATDPSGSATIHLKQHNVQNAHEALQNTLINILEKRSGTDGSETEHIHSDIDARMEIDQRYFQNRFKILSIDAPILYKLYT